MRGILIISTFYLETLSVSNTEGYKMKRIVTNMTLGLALLSFTACTTQPNILRDASKIPVVLHGEKSNDAKYTMQNTEFITLIPAGTSIPFNIKVNGDVFMQSVEKTFPVKLKQDTYIYGAKNNYSDIFNLWISYDKKNWKTMEETYKGSLALEVKVTQEETAINLGFAADSKN